VTSTLNGTRQLTLVLRASARDAPRQHLTLIVQVSLKLICILVITVFDPCFAKIALTLLTPLACRRDVAHERLSLVSLF